MRRHDCTGEDCGYCEAEISRAEEDRLFGGRDDWQAGQDRYESYLDRIGGG